MNFNSPYTGSPKLLRRLSASLPPWLTGTISLPHWENGTASGNRSCPSWSLSHENDRRGFNYAPHHRLRR